MSQCPTCAKHYDIGVRFCPEDGTPLTDTAAASGTRTPAGATTKKLQVPLNTVLGNRYKLLEMRGGGGMAKVYRAVDVTLEREVAVKLINPELRAEPEFDARFQREARIASQLADPHIVVVHDFGIDPEHGPYLVMEYLQGQSLRERLQTGPLPLKAGLQLSAQLILALIHAHNKGIVHRDIKPDNIFLLNQSGVRLHVRVLDFGIARIYKSDDPGRAETLTQPGAVMGTPRYMSPEQLAGNPVDARSDLFSAALVIHEAITGQLPYVVSKKLTELCPEATPALQSLVEHCLKPNPQERPASAVEVYLRLQELGKASGVLLLPPGAMEKLLAARQAQEPTVTYVPSGRRLSPWLRKWLVALAVAAVLALLVWGLLALVKSFKNNAAASGNETLLGLKVGDSRDTVMAKMGQPPERERHGDPWHGDFKESVGHVLKPVDLGDPAALARLDFLIWSNDTVGVLLLDREVRAVVARTPYRAVSGRNIEIGTGALQLEHAYSEEPEIGKFHVGPPPDEAGLPPLSHAAFASWAWAKKKVPPKYGRFYRYDSLGIGYEVQDEKVTAITLYPAVAP